MSCIYALTEPDDLDAIRYIGKTKLPVEARYFQHLKDKRPSYKFRWINSLGGRKPCLVVLEECEQNDLSDREIYWIGHYRSLGYRLTNMSDGGDGGDLVSISGYKKTLEHCSNIAKALLGKSHSEEHKRK